MQNYNIRLAVDSDVKLIANLDKAANLTYWNINQYKECLSNSMQRLYVLELNGVISGALAMSVVDNSADILQLWIKRSCQGHGWAKKIFNSVLADLQKLYNIKQVFLEVREDNHSAIKLYRGLGFEVIDTRADYYIIAGVKHNALVMSLGILI